MFGCQLHSQLKMTIKVSILFFPYNKRIKNKSIFRDKFLAPLMKLKRQFVDLAETFKTTNVLLHQLFSLFSDFIWTHEVPTGFF